MSTFGNMLNMYLLLQNSVKRMKIKEIAEYLEVSERRVREYKDYFEQAEIYIDSKGGRYGGYKLLNDNHLLNLNIREEELVCLLSVLEQLDCEDSLFKKDFKSVLDKITISRRQLEASVNSNIYSIGNKSSYKDKSFEKKKTNLIYKALLKKKKLRIKYTSISSGSKERIIHPYNLFQYKSFLYVIGYCENRGLILEFKIVRIEDIEILEEEFIILEAYDYQEYVDKSIGIHRGKKMDVVLEIEYPMAQIIKESVWEESQEIIETDRNSILFKATLMGKDEIMSWILSMGDNVKVLRPDKLRSEIFNKLEKMQKNFLPDNISPCTMVK